MRFERISIRGYGRLKDLDLHFRPGLQVILGPNERGKSTIRAFLVDMLYGQKRSADKRIYDDANELRTPWADAEIYGGSMVYALDDGTRIEVSRNFHKQQESVQVYDQTHAKDITGTFARLRNREIDFAARQLGIGKSVFLGTATISHLSLEELGDKDALDEIREKILSLADSGDETRSSSRALKRIEQRLATIGRPNARTKPLPAARARLADLDKERAAVAALLGELAEIDEKRRVLREQSVALRAQKADLEAKLQLIELHELDEALRQVHALDDRINAATQHCFALSAVREFPLDKGPEVQRAETRVETARLQCTRLEGELDELTQQPEAATGEEESEQGEDIPEDLEARYNDLTARHQTLRARLSDVEVLVETGEQRLEEAQVALQALPDFGRAAPDPVEWLTQLSSSFRVALNARREECESRDRLRGEIAERAARLEPGRRIFGEIEDFPERARAYTLGRRRREESTAERQDLLHRFRTSREDITEDLPGNLWLSVLCWAILAAAIGWYFVQQTSGILIFSGVIGLCAAIFTGRWIYAKARLAQLAAQIDDLETAPSAESDREGSDDAALIDGLLTQAECSSVRELEALYDEYRMGCADLEARQRVLDEQELRASEAEERVPLLLERYRETFRRVGEEIEKEDDVADAANHAIGRYQEYREAKRTLSDSRSNLEKRQSEFKALREELGQCRDELVAVEQTIRELMRNSGFREEQTYESTSAALRAYRNQLLADRARKSRRAVLMEKAQTVAAALAAERRRFSEAEEALRALLDECGATSTADWQRLAKDAKEYQELWSRRTGFLEQRKAILRGRAPEEMGAILAPHLPLDPKPLADRAAIKSEIGALAERIDASLKEEHSLHIDQTERGAGRRSLSEIDEERGTVQRHIGEMALEHDAATYAMALIEDIARDKHARIAPKLAARASSHLATITKGAYDELLLSRDLTLSVRIPQIDRMSESPERTLSKGTVDQVYLSLRLALVERLGEQGERIPMILDDPFANYDDERLGAALDLLVEVSGNHQVLLFTCREDVVKAAERRKTDTIRL